MGYCVLCGNKTSFLGECESCGLSNVLSKIKNNCYHFEFSGDVNFDFPLDRNLSMEEFIQKKGKTQILKLVEKQKETNHKLKEKQERVKKIQKAIEETHKLENLKLENEHKMAEEGYYKGLMCPFTVAKVGGTRAATLAFTGASINEYVWKHSQCLADYCAIWDPKNKQCSIKTISQKLSIKE